MQIKGLHKNIYRLYQYARTQECLEAYREKYLSNVKTWEKLKSEGVCDKTCQEICGMSRSTYYAHKKILKDLEKNIAPPSKRPKEVNKPRWGEAEKQLVLLIRRENPTYGKNKIAIILKRDHGQTISESTVGRILTRLTQQGLITKSLSALRTKRKRSFKKHAKPWTYKEYKLMKIGERVQIDHMTVSKNGISVKHFQAWDRRSKFIHSAVFSQAKAKTAKRFLLDFIAKVPFKVSSIQVDGGSEFMAEFEETCELLKISLIVLPPAKPTYNGGVERANRSFREEFYARPHFLEDSVRGIQAELSNFLLKYNSYRPHRSLNGLTPIAYLNATYNESLSQSSFI